MKILPLRFNRPILPNSPLPSALTARELLGRKDCSLLEPCFVYDKRADLSCNFCCKLSSESAINLANAVNLDPGLTNLTMACGKRSFMHVYIAKANATLMCAPLICCSMSTASGAHPVDQRSHSSMYKSKRSMSALAGIGCDVGVDFRVELVKEIAGKVFQDEEAQERRERAAL
jgi:hypothetical protein